MLRFVGHALSCLEKMIAEDGVDAASYEILIGDEDTVTVRYYYDAGMGGSTIHFPDMSLTMEEEVVKICDCARDGAKKASWY